MNIKLPDGSQAHYMGRFSDGCHLWAHPDCETTTAAMATVGGVKVWTVRRNCYVSTEVSVCEQAISFMEGLDERARGEAGAPNEARTLFELRRNGISLVSVHTTGGLLFLSYFDELEQAVHERSLGFAKGVSVKGGE